MDLINDCWMLIFEYLDVGDQISAARTCRRFHELVVPLWRKKYAVFDTFKDKPAAHEDFALVMEGICGTLEALILDNFKQKDWEVIYLHSYPNLKKLLLSFRFFIPDDCMLKMTEIFPNLSALRLDTPYISGKHIENWRNLETLEFLCCKNFEFCYFERILEKVQLKSLLLNIFQDNVIWKSELAFAKFCNLEIITIPNDKMLNHFILADLSIFPNLTSLVFPCFQTYNLIWDTLKSVVDHKANNLKSIMVDLDFPLHRFFMKPFKNLINIGFLRQDFSDFHLVHKFSPNLRIFTLFKCTRLLTAKDLDVLLEIKNFIYISIELCTFNVSQLHIDIADVSKHRTDPLQFNFFLNKYVDNEKNCEELITVLVRGKSPLVKLTEEPPKNSTCRNSKLLTLEFLNDKDT